jgi:hypothetical protein
VFDRSPTGIVRACARSSARESWASSSALASRLLGVTDLLFGVGGLLFLGVTDFEVGLEFVLERLAGDVSPSLLSPLPSLSFASELFDAVTLPLALFAALFEPNTSGYRSNIASQTATMISGKPEVEG